MKPKFLKTKLYYKYKKLNLNTKPKKPNKIPLFKKN